VLKLIFLILLLLSSSSAPKTFNKSKNGAQNSVSLGIVGRCYSLSATSVAGHSLRQDTFAPEVLTDQDPRSYAGYQSPSFGLL
jgi:hypothetical protein